MALSSEEAMQALSAAGLSAPGMPSAPGSGPGISAPGTGPVHEVRVGRDPDPAVNDIVLENPVVSARHARISRHPQGGLMVQDLGSTNGTYLRGERIRQRVVSLEDDIYLGSAALRMSDPRVARLVIAVRMPIPPGRIFSVGSAPDADVRIHDPEVAPQHCQMIAEPEGGFQVRDLGSINGTAIDNPSFRIQEANAQPSSTLLLGAFRLPLPLLRRMLDVAAGVDDGGVVQAAIQGIDLDKPRITIGRLPGNDLVLPHPSVSGRHARISRQPDGTFRVEDLGSTNGTYLEGQRITTGVAQPGHRVTVGAVTLLLGVRGIEGAQRAKVRLDLIDLTLTVKDRSTGKPRRLLDQVNMSIFPGELIGMLGPSGAGKSTLLMTVLGLLRPDPGGGVLLNGRPLFEQYEAFRTNVGYVPQDDIVHPELTVREALRYACKLRLPAGTSGTLIEESIESTLREVGLWEQRDLRIGSPEQKVLSGGQRRRVNLAVELVTDPSLLILDEPTSGLSWTDAADVIGTLRRLADNGRTIVVTIHQPDYQEYEKFDSVCILGRGGKLLFFGPPSPDSYAFFGASPNKPREMFDHLEQLPADQWRETFRTTETFRRFVVERQGNAQAQTAGPPPRPRRRSSLRQFPLLFSRSLKLTFRNPFALTLLLIQAPLLAVLIGLTTGGATSFEVAGFGCSPSEGAVDTCEGVDDRLACDPTRRMAVQAYAEEEDHLADRVKDPRTALLAMLMALFLPMIIASSNVLVAERTVYGRERLAGLNIFPYILARLFVLFLLGSIVVALHVPIAWWLCDLEGNLLAYLFVGFLTTSTASATGMALSAAVSHPVSALWGINFLVIPQLLFAGSISRLEGATRTLSWLTSTRYGLESLVHVDLGARSDVLSDCQLERYLENMPNFFSDPGSPMGAFVAEAPLAFASGGMGALTVSAFVLTWLLLRVRDR